MAKRFTKKRTGGKTTITMTGAKGGARWIVHSEYAAGTKNFQIDWVVLQNCNVASATNMLHDDCVALTVRVPAWQNEYLGDLVARAKTQTPSVRASKSLLVTEAIDLLAAVHS